MDRSITLSDELLDYIAEVGVREHPVLAKCRAETAAGEIMGVRHTTLPLHGVQFHPESVLTPEGGQLLTNFMRMT